MQLNCIIIDDEYHAIAELSELVSKSPQLNLVGEFSRVDEALVFLQSAGKIHLIFSDISMPSINGIDGASLLKKYTDYFIYVTAHRQYSLNAFDVGADGYLVKPINTVSFFKRVDEIYNRAAFHTPQTTITNSALFVKGNSKNSFHRIDYNEVMYIEGMLNYVNMYTSKSKITTYMGIKDILRELEHTQLFLRVNKSIIISTNYLHEVNGNTVFLLNGPNFTIGATYRDAFHSFVMKRILTKNRGS